MKTIRTSEEFCNNYSDISKLCHTSAEPVYITRNGKVDLVAMSIEMCEKLTGRAAPTEEPCAENDCTKNEGTPR